MPEMGIIMPNMGIKSSAPDTTPSEKRGVKQALGRYVLADKPSPGLADALFTTTQQRVLGALYGHPQRSFTVSELIASTAAGSGAVQRELAKLATSGLLTIQPVGNQKRYQANPNAPIHAELVAIVQKTIGLAEPLRVVLTPLAKNILAAFVYGSVAKHADTATSDIDLVIVSDQLGYADVMQVLHPAIERLKREINPTIYTRAELAKRIASGNAFVERVLAQPKLWLIGNKHGLAV